LTNNNVLSLAVSGTNLFAGTRLSVCLSTNNGTSWTDVSSGLTNPYVISLAVSGPNIFAGTWGSGVWRRPLSEMITSVHIISSELPSEFLLRQNFPNPFNPSTSIQYDIPVNSFVKLVVYDITGKEVTTLVNETMPAGKYEAVWNGKQFASGIYFARLDVGSYKHIIKMLMIK
jgi:hypothetical protein